MRLEIISRSPANRSSGLPLLFVHGAFHAAWCWDVHFLDYFAARGFAAHAVSLRAHGSSDGRTALRRTRVADYVEDIAQTVRQFPIPPVLIGHSMGARVVQKYLETDSARAAVLLGPPPHEHALRTIFRIARRHPIVFAKVNLTLRLWPLVETPQLAHEALFSSDLPNDQVLDYWKQLQDESFRALLGTLLSYRLNPAKVRTPMFVIGGARDSLITADEIGATARAYHARFEIIPDVAHDMMLDTRWEGVASRILAWLTAVDASTSPSS